MNEWQEAVAYLAASSASRQLHPQALDELSCLEPGSPVVVACSGGADSVYLLLMLAAYAESQPLRLQVAHFNHNLRGEQSAADAQFVAQLAAALQLPYHHAERPHGRPDDESSLREDRYQFMLEVMHLCCSRTLALGHHADDANESLLMGALTGAGLAGLSAPHPVSRFMDGHVRLRPLLLLRHSEIEARLRALHLVWREDPSNADPRYTRNWIRHRLLPMVNERLPQDINAALARSHGQLREALMAIDSVVDGLQLDVSGADGLDCRPLFGQPRAIARRAWMRWWLRHYPAIPFPQGCMEDLLDQLCDGACKTPLAVASDLLLRWDAGGSRLRVESGEATADSVRIHGTVHWAGDGTLVCLPDGAVLSRHAVAIDGQSGYRNADPSSEAWLAVAPDAILVVRGWCAGDRYRPLGSSGRRKLQDMFTDAKIDRLRRACLPVVCDHTGAILWVPGFAPAEQARVGKHTDSALKLTYQMC